jgi:hypothetical protein
LGITRKGVVHKINIWALPKPNFSNQRDLHQDRTVDVIELFNQLKKRIKMQSSQGVTLLELTIVISVLLIAFILINPYTFTSWFYKGADASHFNIDTLTVFNKIETLAEHGGRIEIAATHDMTLSNDFGVWRIFAYDFPTGGPPSRVAIQKDGGPISFLANYIQELTDPIRPGFEVTYRDQDQSITTVTENIFIIDVKLSFWKDPSIFGAETSFSFDSTTHLLQTDVGPTGFPPAPENLHSHWWVPPKTIGGPPGGDFHK